MSGRAPLATLLAASALLLAGCEEEEQVPEQDLTGSVMIRANLVDQYLDGDPRKIGMVYVGIYEGYDPEVLGYPYPTMGPRVGDNPVGDALPYGGTSIGVYAFGCYRALTCQVLTGRYASLDDLLAVNPLEEDGQPVDAETMYDQCTWYYGWNSIEEFHFIGPEQLDFQKNADGDYVADFKAWHGRLPDGARVWAFVDNDFTTCSSDAGVVNRRRDEDSVYFREGTNYPDVLNYPDKYVTTGDFISSQPPTIENGVHDGYTVVLDYVRE